MATLWAESSPGVWERPLGAGEVWFPCFIPPPVSPNREPYLLMGYVEATSTESSTRVIKAIKEAWKALRLLKSPDIATFRRGDKKVYNVPASSEELENWVDETLIIEPIDTKIETVTRQIENLKSQQLLPYLHVLPASTSDGSFQGSLAVFVGHWRTDAGGCFMVLNDLCQFASDLLGGGLAPDALKKHEFGAETKLLVPALDQICMPDTESSVEAQQRVEKRFMDFYSGFPAVENPIIPQRATLAPRVTQVQRTYQPDTAFKLHAACKSNHITVGAAIHSAFAGSAWQMADSSKKDRPHTGAIPTDARRRLPKSSLYGRQGPWSATHMLPFSIPAGKDFLTTARLINDQYSVTAEETWWTDDLRVHNEWIMKQPAEPPSPPPAHPFFSSFGVLDGVALTSVHNKIQINYASVSLDSTAPGLILRIFTFRERLNIQMAWAEQYHSEEQVKIAWDIIDTEVQKGLGIKLEVEEERKWTVW